MKENKLFKRLMIFAIATFMCLSAFTLTTSAASCTYQICVDDTDTYRDTWNGGYLDVWVNVVFQMTISATDGMSGTWECFPLSVNDGDVILMDYTYGSYPSENVWKLINANGYDTYDMQGGYSDTTYDGTETVDCSEMEPPLPPGEDCTSAVAAVEGLNSAPQQPYWYHYTPSEDCVLKITSNLMGQSVDTDLEVYDACGGTLVASTDDDYSGYYDYASTVSFPATSTIDYKIYWDDHWSSSAFDFTITEITDCDVGVTAIYHPTTADGPGSITPEVYVSDFIGGGATCDVVYMEIYEGSLGAEVYFNDFESDDGGYTHDGSTDIWEWGTPTNGPAGAYSGTNVWGTDLDSSYGDYCDATLTTGEIDLSTVTSAGLSFWLWYDTENYYDGCNVKISTDGTNFDVLGSYLDPYNEDAATTSNSGIPGEPCWSGHGQGYWEFVTFDLDSYVSGSIWLRFHMGSDSSVGSYPGMFIDDVYVYQSGATTPVHTCSNLGFSAPGTATLTPSWTPSAAGIYSVVAWTEASCDDVPDNDQMEVQNLMIGDIDVGVSAINVPQTLMGPIDFHPNVDVTNYGDLDLTNVPVHAYIVKPPEMLFSEDFEGSFTVAGSDVTPKSLEGNLIKKATATSPGEIEGKFLWNDRPQFQAGADWNIVDSNGGATWHTTTTKSVSPTHSMVCGDDTTEIWEDGSYDFMFSAQSYHVGSAAQIELEAEYEVGPGLLLIGNSLDGQSDWHCYYWWFGGSGFSHLSVPLFADRIDPNGDTYIAIGFADYFGYGNWYLDTGPYVDDIELWTTTTYLYDDYEHVSVDAGDTVEVEFADTFNADGLGDLDFTFCTEQPYDEVPANDCDGLTFHDNAPVYIVETGFGFTTIQDAIDAAEDGQTVIATDGTYNEDIVIDKPITVTGENIESTKDATTCTWDHDHGSIIHGTVTIQDTGGSGGGPAPPCDCDYEVCLLDSYGDGWDVDYNGPNTLDIYVDGTLVLDGIYLADGYGPECYTFTVESGDTIDADYTAVGYFPEENEYIIYDSEGNMVTDQGASGTPGDWSGIATCPPCNGGSGGATIFQKFDVNPLTTFDTDGAAIFVVNSSNVIVRQNTVHNVNGMVDDTMFTISGIKVAAYNEDYPQSDITIQNNTVRAILNENMTGGGGGGTSSLDEGFEGTFPPTGWTLESHGPDTAPWQQSPMYVHSGTYSAMGDMGGGGTHTDEWLITPTLDLSSADGELRFWRLFRGGSAVYPDWFNVLLSNDNGATWPVTLQSLDYNDDDPYTFDTEVILDLSSYISSTTKIAFQYISEWGYHSYIDDVTVTTGGGGGGTPTYGGANAIMVQGYLDAVDILNNRMEDVHSAGWCYGVEITPTASGSFDGSFADTLLDEGFEGTGLPTGWTSIDNDGDGYDWDCDWLYPRTGLECAASASYINGVGALNPDNYLITPQLGLTSYSGGSADLTFWTAAQDPSYPSDYIEVWISTTGSGATDFTDMVFAFTETDDTWKEHVVDLSAYTGEDIYVAFVHTASYDQYWIKVDDVLVTAEGGGGPGPSGHVMVACNYLVEIGDGSEYDVWNDTFAAPFPGVMLTIDETVPGAGDGDASNVTVTCNYFDPDCHTLIYAIINKDPSATLDATYNFYGVPNGPGGGVQDPMTGYFADGYGSDIAGGLVHFDPWLGVHAEATASSVDVKTGEAINFDAEGSFAFCFDGCEDCCSPDAQHIQYLWNFGDGTYSANKAPVHTYNQEGTYHVSLMIDAAGFVYWPNFMYNWDYIDVTVTDSGAPLAANADGGNLGGYETTVEETVQLYGTDTGGMAPYSYSWDLGNGETSYRQNPVVGYKEPGTYTVTLTVVATGGEIATDTAIVTVYGIEELVVNIGGSSHVAEGDAVDFTSSVSGGKAPYSYAWNFGDGIASTEAMPTHVYENSGTYTVTLTVTDANDQTETKTKTVTVSTTDTSEVEITNVDGGLLLRATINSEEPVDWSIDVDGTVLFGGHASGTTQANTETVKLPFTFGLGSVDITITAGSVQEHYTATMIGPFVLRLQEA